MTTPITPAVIMAAKLPPVHVEPKAPAPAAGSEGAAPAATVTPTVAATAPGTATVTATATATATGSATVTAAPVQATAAAPVQAAAAQPEVSTSAPANRAVMNKEVKLDELSKYFHLPEKAVAKELGICLTSLKKLCRSYGITRWPFRKLKSLERTMKKVQTEDVGANADGSAATEGKTTGGNEVKRKPYTVGNKTVFLSDEELEVFKMTMGKEACDELKPTPMAQLEPALFNTATLAAASTALASAARGAEAKNDDENPRISTEVKGSSLVITNWSTLWSQPQLKTKLLEPLQGTCLKVSPDGITADLEFSSEETAKRALRICKMAETQVMQTTTGPDVAAASVNSLFATPSNPTDAVAVSPPVSGSVQALLSEGFTGIQPPSTHAAQNMWASFLTNSQGASSGADGGDSTQEPKSNTNQVQSAPKSVGALGDSLPSPPMSSTTMGLLLDGGAASAPLTMGAPLTALFPNMFQTDVGMGGAKGLSPPGTQTLYPIGSPLISFDGLEGGSIYQKPASIVLLLLFSTTPRCALPIPHSPISEPPNLHASSAHDPMIPGPETLPS